MHTLTIFYDAACGICTGFRRWMQEQPAYVALDFVPYDSPEALRRCPGLPDMRADEEIVVMGDEGSLWQGAAAWVMCLWALREYREWSARLASPAMMAAARRIVHWISGNRIGISRLLRLKSDRDLTTLVNPIGCSSGACAAGVSK